MKEKLLKEIEELTDMYAFNEIKNENYSEDELKEVLETLKRFSK